MTKTPAIQSSTDGCVTGVFLLARRIHVLLAGISTAARKKGRREPKPATSFLNHALSNDRQPLDWLRTGRPLTMNA
ncbi:hypothetical protein C4O30_11905 [Lactiplantibacillus plantarum]|nr:hypothetical protein C4O30_11905 [Lactiplantibacillus plantarum]